MTASPEMLTLFDKWQRAHLVAHYAAPCADDLMNTLVNYECERQQDMASLPAANADDLLLKLFPLILGEFEPQLGDAPLMPKFESAGRLIGAENETAFASVIRDLMRLSPSIASAATAPYAIPGKGEAA